MEWYALFRPHILDRGIEYYEDGNVIDFECTEDTITARVTGSEDYIVEIDIEKENVLGMYCSCPYARDGKNCKHMAAVLFRFEEMLSELDCEQMVESFDLENSLSIDSMSNEMAKKKQEIEALVAKIPENDIRDMLVSRLMSDNQLKNQLQMKYAFKMTSKMMIDLRNEIDQIIYNNSRGGFVDWYHASDFCTELSSFLDTKVNLLIENDCLKQAFEITNVVFHCIGNVDMDDSDGESTYVLNSCYECWETIIHKADGAFKNEVKTWFEDHRNGYVLDFMEEYMDEILFQEFGNDEKIREEIQLLDEMIAKAKGNDCGIYYSVYHGYENAILKRIQYMEKLNYTAEEIEKYKQENRRFFAIRELEITDAISRKDYKKAIDVLKESKSLDVDYVEQTKNYCEQLITIYDKLNMKEEHCKELESYLIQYRQFDLKYYKMLKAEITNEQKWSEIVDRIVEHNPCERLVCDVLQDEKRYEQLMCKIEQSSGNVELLDRYERVLRKNNPDKVMKIYVKYLSEAVECANDRNKYKHLMSYLKKIAACSGGGSVAKDIAKAWRQEYKRRSAMMDELKKAGF